ncbi:hypothetical protein BH09PSE3_BH09PSE3_03930 [soil metagenome]
MALNLRRFTVAIALTSVLTIGVAATTAPAQPAPAVAAMPVSTTSTGYILGASDEIQVSVYGQPDLSVKTTIKADGTVILAFLGSFAAQGKTTAQLSSDIGRAYATGGYLTSPSVNVEVTTYGSKSVTVYGDVTKTGIFPLDRSYSVASMIALAGGVKEGGAKSVLIVHPGGGAPERISLMDIQTAATRMLIPGDVLMVPPAEMVFVYGQVNKPGNYPITPGMTFRQAMASAGGPTIAASTGKILVKRGQQSLRNLSLDDVIQPDDVLVIKEKLF